MSAPETRRDDIVETLHGQPVADPYRWLEDPDSEETRAWVRAQNAHTREHLDALGSRGWFGETMDAIVRRSRAGTPDRVAGRYLVTRSDGSRQQATLWVADTLEELVAGGRLLLDPNTFSDDGTSSLSGYTASRDDRWLTYLVSDGGSDWQSIHRLDLTTGEHADEVLTKVKFSEATWLPDHASYLYNHYPTEGAGVGTETAALPVPQLRVHRLDTPQDDDEVLLELPEDPSLSAWPTLSHDGRWLAVTIHRGTSEKNRLWLYPVSTDDGVSRIGEPLAVVDEEYAAWEPVRFDGDDLLVRTDHEAPRGRVVRMGLDLFADTGRFTLTDVVPERAETLRHAQAVGDEVLTLHLVDAQPRLTRFSLAGEETGVLGVEGGQVLELNGDEGEDEVFAGVSTVTTPSRSYRVDLTSGEVTEVTGLEPEGGSGWVAPEVVSERRRATSTDGTEVPYFLVHRADVPLVGPRPTLLYGYGGYNIPELAQYRPAFAGWLAAGGVLVIANLRGGGEYGAEWHDAGRLQRKQNVFDDFAAVAEHLVAEGVSTPGQVAVYGGSNGGLLVAATLLQHPDLVGAALASVPVTDMLRFHLFTVGRAWFSDFGSPEDPEMFPTLLAYSPLHNVSKGTAYPPTLVLTGDHDDRVVPAHSYKFTAELQHAQGGDAPVLARIETSTGHSVGKPLRVVAAETADLLAFAAEHTGLVPAAG
ncbi:MAG: S9 family peptidase [Nocardioidaceae bacterium]|nr:S9 family peptidase [Nocardioidaceae bacterium]NUS50539.1 S9 family peptidase [Nocardioidaceae bacterium]